jgi:hypothetical protein
MPISVLAGPYWDNSLASTPTLRERRVTKLLATVLGRYPSSAIAALTFSLVPVRTFGCPLTTLDTV